MQGATSTAPIEPPEETIILGDDVKTELRIESSAFEAGSDIPVEYSCEGSDKSPALDWYGVPIDTQSFALIMEDPDAPVGTWVHWVVYNIPTGTRGFEAGIETDPPEGILYGVNDWGDLSYGGPCPPSGTHRYFFYLFALDTELSVDEGASSNEIRAIMANHILASAELMGIYTR